MAVKDVSSEKRGTSVFGLIQKLHVRLSLQEIIAIIYLLICKWMLVFFTSVPQLFGVCELFLRKSVQHVCCGLKLKGSVVSLDKLLMRG